MLFSLHALAVLAAVVPSTFAVDDYVCPDTACKANVPCFGRKTSKLSSPTNSPTPDIDINTGSDPPTNPPTARATIPGECPVYPMTLGDDSASDWNKSPHTCPNAPESGGVICRSATRVDDDGSPKNEFIVDQADLTMGSLECWVDGDPTKVVQMEITQLVHQDNDNTKPYAGVEIKITGGDYYMTAMFVKGGRQAAGQAFYFLTGSAGGKGWFLGDNGFFDTPTGQGISHMTLCVREKTDCREPGDVTMAPTGSPTNRPTKDPTDSPTPEPTLETDPSVPATPKPTQNPTKPPTSAPSRSPLEGICDTYHQTHPDRWAADWNNSPHECPNHEISGSVICREWTGNGVGNNAFIPNQGSIPTQTQIDNGDPLATIQCVAGNTFNDPNPDIVTLEFVSVHGGSGDVDTIELKVADGQDYVISGVFVKGGTEKAGQAYFFGANTLELRAFWGGTEGTFSTPFLQAISHVTLCVLPRDTCHERPPNTNDNGIKTCGVRGDRCTVGADSELPCCDDDTGADCVKTKGKWTCQ